MHSISVFLDYSTSSMIRSTLDRTRDTSGSASQQKQSSMIIITTYGLNTANNMPSLLRSAPTIFLSSTGTVSTVESTDYSPRHYQSNMVYSSPKPHAAWSTMVIHGSTGTQHTESLATQTTSPCCESSRVFSGMEQERGESTREVDRSKMASSLQDVKITLSSLSSTISPPDAGLEMCFPFQT